MPRLFVAVMLGLAAACSGEPVASSPPQCHSRSNANIGGGFNLISHTGERVDEKQFLGRETLVFFGFTYCPDICPSTLYMLASALEQIPAERRPQVLLISVDPERDTPQTLADYVGNDGFPAGMIGLTGNNEEIAAVAKAFAAGYARFDYPDGDYTIDHTSIIYLMDRNWRLQTFFTHGATPAMIAACFVSPAANSGNAFRPTY